MRHVKPSCHVASSPLALRAQKPTTCCCTPYHHPQDEEGTPIKQDVKKGKLRFYPYNINWNYGLLPQVRGGACVVCVCVCPFQSWT